ncbi:MAG: matrixin family metalloprotease [Chloroflexi bacterium]|nr:matrixin family metalloprotease [Chloroflexota bacterium]
MLAKRHRTVVVLALCVLSLAVAPGTRAMAAPYGLERLCDEAASVVWGEVVSVQSHWDDGRTGIASTVVLAVNQYLRGAGAATLNLEVEGGEIDGLGQWVEDAPRFAAGEEAVVFLDKRARVLGGAQGKFTGVAGRVVEAEMQPLSQFVSQLQERLGTAGGALSARTVRYGAQLALDAQAVPGPATAEPGAVKPQSTEVLLNETFDGTLPGAWTLSGSPTWGPVSYRAFSGANSGYCAAAGDRAVLPPGPYPANTDSWMVWGPFSLTDAVGAALSYRHFTRTQSGVDYLSVAVSVDGYNYYGLLYSGDWTTATGNEQGWMSDVFDLTNVPTLGNLCGSSAIYLGIGFHSDATGLPAEQEGVYLDDIVLRRTIADSGAPQIDAVEPTARSAGTSQKVTLTGRNFGATRGTVRFWSVQSTWVSAAIVSWSDTSIVCRVPARASSHTTQAIAVTNALGTGYAGFTVTWSYLGYKWPGNPVLIRYNIGTGTSDCSGENVAVRQGANAWSTVDYAYHTLKFWGTTSREAPVRDGVNVVSWGHTAGSLATTTIWYDPSQKTILEFDMVFEDDYLWKSNTSCPTARYDVRNVAAHEFGHALGLADQYGAPDATKTMYGFAFPGEIAKRTLDKDAIAGAQWIY